MIIHMACEHNINPSLPTGQVELEQALDDTFNERSSMPQAQRQPRPTTTPMSDDIGLTAEEKAVQRAIQESLMSSASGMDIETKDNLPLEEKSTVHAQTQQSQNQSNQDVWSALSPEEQAFQKAMLASLNASGSAGQSQSRTVPVRQMLLKLIS